MLPAGQPEVQSHAGAALPGLLPQSGGDAAQVSPVSLCLSLPLSLSASVSLCLLLPLSLSLSLPLSLSLFILFTSRRSRLNKLNLTFSQTSSPFQFSFRLHIAKINALYYSSLFLLCYPYLPTSLYSWWIFYPVAHSFFVDLFIHTCETRGPCTHSAN